MSSSCFQLPLPHRYLSALLALLLGLLDGHDLASLQCADGGHLAAVGSGLVERFSELQNNSIKSKTVVSAVSAVWGRE